MDSLTELFPQNNQVSRKSPHTITPEILKTNPTSSAVSGKKAGDILLEHIDNLRCDKLRAYVDGATDLDNLIQEYVFQVNSAIELYKSFVDNSVFNQAENHNLQLAQKRAQNGLKWLEDLR